MKKPHQQKLQQLTSEKREELNNHPKLDPYVKRQWIAALCSGKYGQAQCVLFENKNDFCCLGLLMHIRGHAKDTIFGMMPGDDIAPKNDVEKHLSKPVQGVLASLNDWGWSFKEIAWVINEYL